MLLKYCAGSKKYSTGDYEVIRAVLPTENITLEQLQEQYTEVVAKDLDFFEGKIQEPFGTPNALVILNGEVRPKNANELLEDKQETILSQVKLERNRLLADTDFTQLADTPITETSKEEFRIYRQSLRDITINLDYDNVIYPTMPKYVKE